MFRTLAVVLASVALASAACDQPTLAGCASSLSSCIMKNPTSPSAICSCRGAYDGCIKDAGCPAATVSAVVKSCEDAGCTASQCAPSLLRAESPVVGLGEQSLIDSIVSASSCDGTTISGCSASLSSCIMSDPTSPSAICNCRGTFDGCLKSAGCPAASVDAAVKSCEAAGCSANVCEA